MPILLADGTRFGTLCAVDPDPQTLTLQQADLLVVLGRLVATQLERDQAEEVLRGIKDELERRVRERTAEIRTANERLLVELAERKRVEEALRESGASLATAQRIAHLGNWETDLVRGSMWWSDEVYRIFGFAPRQFAPSYEAIAQAVHPDDRERVGRWFQDIFTGSRDSIELRIVRPDGAIRMVQAQAESIVDESGKPLRVVGTMQDITERKRAERQSAALSALGQQLSAARTAKEAARIIAAVADDLLGWDAYSLVLYSPADDTLHSVLNLDLIDGRRADVPPARTGHIPGPLARRIMAEGGQLLLRDGRAAPDEGLQPFGDLQRRAASLLFVPIRTGAATVGILSIQSYTPHAYTAADLAVLQSLADHCGGALERVRAEEALRESEARYATVVRQAAEGILLFEPETKRILEVNVALCHLLGYTAEELLAMTTYEIVAHERGDIDAYAERILTLGLRVVGERRYRRKDGTLLTMEVSANPIAYGGRQVVCAVVHDITERKRAEEQLAHQASHDPLTDLPNRTLFAERLGRALARAARRRGAVAVLFVDLDGSRHAERLDSLKAINNRLGHDAGDQFLVAIAKRLRACLRPGDTAARLGGDEFVLLLAAITGVQDAVHVAERILERLAAPFAIGGREVTVSASIGIALNAAGRDTPEALLQAADMAMYQAKDQGKARYAVFDAGIDAL